MSSTTYSDVFKYFKPYTRAEAEAHIARTRAPLIRTSSRPGHYALTYAVGERIQHALLRITSDEKIECVTEDGEVYATFPSATHLIYRVAPPPLPVYSVPPPVVVTSTTEDPVLINES